MMFLYVHVPTLRTQVLDGCSAESMESLFVIPGQWNDHVHLGLSTSKDLLDICGVMSDEALTVYSNGN
jgi:hypothetical protein